MNFHRTITPCLAIGTMLILGGCTAGSGNSQAGGDSANDSSTATTESTTGSSASARRSTDGTTEPAPFDVAQLVEVTAPAQPSAPDAGSVAPGFSWKTATGDKRSLADYRGQVVLLNFWGTWCPPCRRELPDIVKIREEMKGKGFEVIGICLENVEDPVPHVAAFAKSNKLAYPLVIGNADIVAAYGGIEAVPTTFIIDGTGKIRQKILGMASEKDFRAAIAAAQ